MASRSMTFRTALILAAAVGLPGCDDSTGPENGTTVAVAFRASGAAQAMSPARSLVSGAAQAGLLALESVWLVVDEFKLEGNEDACESPEAPPDCAKFEAEPHLLAVPLVEGETETVIEETAPPGTFTRLKFETKASTGDPGVQAAIDAAGITDWPGDASLLVTGTFTPDGAAEAEPFRVFFDAEVKVVLPLPDPLVVTEDGPESQAVFIVVEPGGWFLSQEGTDMDLRTLDYDATGEVHKLEVKLEDGFTKIELEGGASP